MQEKQCSKCRTTKPIINFRKRSRSKDGYDYQCKLCADSCASKSVKGRSEYWKRYYAIKIVVCSSCGANFNPVGNTNLCKSCRLIACNQCGMKFTPNSRSSLYCSKACHIESQKGKEPEGLKNKRGKKPRTYHLKNRDKHGSALDREWRTNVFERDNYTCQSCKKAGGRLQAHHIKAYKAHPELRHVLSNGVTLCIDCHKKTDSYGWQNYHKNKIAAQRMCQEVLEL